VNEQNEMRFGEFLADMLKKHRAEIDAKLDARDAGFYGQQSQITNLESQITFGFANIAELIRENSSSAPVFKSTSAPTAVKPNISKKPMSQISPVSNIKPTTTSSNLFGSARAPAARGGL